MQGKEGNRNTLSILKSFPLTSLFFEGRRRENKRSPFRAPLGLPDVIHAGSPDRNSPFRFFIQNFFSRNSPNWRFLFFLQRCPGCSSVIRGVVHFRLHRTNASLKQHRGMDGKVGASAAKSACRARKERGCSYRGEKIATNYWGQLWRGGRAKN